MSQDPTSSAQVIVSSNQTRVPDSEVLPKAKHRQFTAEYKLRILQEADRCSQPGELGALLRREGLYSSHLTKWRQQRDQGQLHALALHPRGRKPSQDPQGVVKVLCEGTFPLPQASQQSQSGALPLKQVGPPQATWESPPTLTRP